MSVTSFVSPLDKGRRIMRQVLVKIAVVEEVYVVRVCLFMVEDQVSISLRRQVKGGIG